MKVKELIRELNTLNPDDEIIITSLDDYFIESDFCVRSNHEDENVQEIIINRYFDSRI